MVGRFGEILGTPRQTVGCNHLKVGCMLEKLIVIERNELVGETIIQQFLIQDTSLGEQITQAQIIVLAQEINVGKARTTGLARNVAHAIACPCRNGNHIMKIKLVLHKSVEHTTGKHASHASSFKNQACISINLHEMLKFSCKVKQFLPSFFISLHH